MSVNRTRAVILIVLFERAHTLRTRVSLEMLVHSRFCFRLKTGLHFLSIPSEDHMTRVNKPMAPLRSRTRKSQLHLRLPAEQLESAKIAAQRDGTSTNEFVCRALAEHLERQRAKANGTPMSSDDNAWTAERFLESVATRLRADLSAGLDPLSTVLRKEIAVGVLQLRKETAAVLNATQTTHHSQFAALIERLVKGMSAHSTLPAQSNAADPAVSVR